MVIIQAILDSFIAKNKTYTNRISELRNEINVLQKQKELLRYELKKRESCLCDEREKYRDIISFMDYIKIDRRYLSYRPHEEEFLSYVKAEASLQAQKSEAIETKLQHIEMYEKYLREMVEIQNRSNVLFNRPATRYYMINDSIVIDIYLMDYNARNAFANADNCVYEFTKYTEALKFFSVDGLLENEPISQKNNWNTEMLEIICAICRVSWINDYFIRLTNQFEILKLNNDKKVLRKLRKNERYSPLVLRWKEDVELINSTSQKDNVFYKIYRDVFSEEKETNLRKRIDLWFW